MTGMEHTIEHAARVLNAEGACCGDCGREPGDPLSECPDCERFLTGYARALASSGLLAPAPLREEWAVVRPDWHGELRYDRYDQRIGAERECWHEDQVVRRLVTEWEPADRAEGDGSADQ